MFNNPRNEIELQKIPATNVPAAEPGRKCSFRQRNSGALERLAVSEVQPQARDEGATAWKFRMQVERVQPVIRVEQVEHTDPQLRTPARKPVARRQILLPEIIPRRRGIETGVALAIPGRFPLRERAAAMMEIRRERKLLQSRVLVAFELIESYRRIRNV